MSSESFGAYRCAASWKKVDLHLHSPGVDSFRLPPGSNIETEEGIKEIAAAYVRSLSAAGIQVAAITDYQGIREEWFTRIRDEAERAGIKVFPGAELFFMDGKGYHILTVFEADVEPGEVNRFLDSFNRGKPLRDPGGAHSYIPCPDTRPDRILQQLKTSFNCLIIVPHPGEQQGIMTALRMSNCLDQLLGIMPDAIDHAPPDLLERWKSTGRKGKMMDRLCSTALVEFSDAHSIEEIGTKADRSGQVRQTFVKLSSSIDIEALRLALHDPGLRIRLVPPERPAYHRIIRMKVEGGRFLGDLDMEWSDELNTLTGGRGVGKSAILETLRYALDIPAYSEQSYRESLLKHALGSGSRVTVWVGRPFAEGRETVYRITRVFNESPQVYDEASGRLLNISPTSLFGPPGPPAIMGQREIAFISTSDEHKLRLVDEVIGEEVKMRAADVSSKVEALKNNASEILALQREVTRREEYEKRLQEVQHEIGAYEQLGVVEKLREVTEQALDRQRLDRAELSLSGARTTIAAALSQVATQLVAVIAELRQSQSSQNATLLEAAGAVERLVHEIQSARTDLDAAFARTLSEVSRSRLSWEAATSTLQDEILRIKQSLKTDKLDPDRIVKLQAEAARLGPLVSGLEELRNQAAQLRGKRGELIRDLKKARRAEHEFRFEQAQRISAAVGDRIRIVVKDREQKEPLRRRLRAVLRGSGFREENLERLLRVEGIDGLSLAAAVREGPEAVVRQFGLTPSAAQGLCRWLEEDESRLFELEVASPDDLVDVELKIEEGVYRPMADLSVGQRATAVLLLLLAQENRLLVLDQPEEDLDNRFIVQDIVSILRNHKGRRQVISATHNANIVVLGDAEMVVALDVKDSRATVVQCASVDNKDVRCWIKSVMEGGDTAFRLRAEKYGGGVLID